MSHTATRPKRTFRCPFRLRLSNHNENLTMARHGGEHTTLARLSPTGARGSWRLPVLAVTGPRTGRAPVPGWLWVAGMAGLAGPGLSLGKSRAPCRTAGRVGAGLQGWRAWQSRLR